MQIQTAQGARDRTKVIIGVAVYGALLLIGTLLLANFLITDLMHSKRPGEYLFLMMVGGGIAFTAVLFYLLVPVVIDRYDPEPWWALLAAFLWGATVSCGFAGTINSFIGGLGASIDPVVGDILGGVVSAPIFEELFKGMLVALIFFFLRREFDGVVDGVIYATFTALGFAAMENMLYYSRAGMRSGGDLVFVVILRGILSPWCHPLFTSMTGIGFGLAREARSTWVKVAAPIGGYMAAVLLHAAWNGTATFAGLLTGSNGVAALTMILQLVLFVIFMLAFTGLMIGLVVREGRIIRKNLADEVLIGTLTKEEMELVCSPWGRLRAMFTKGGLRGRKFVGAAATLALKKWHTARAVEGKKMTVSMDFIVPLRQEIARIRAEIGGQPAPGMQPAAPQGYAVPGMPAYMPPAPQQPARPAQPYHQQAYQQQHQQQPQQYPQQQQGYSQQQPYPQQQQPNAPGYGQQPPQGQPQWAPGQAAHGQPAAQQPGWPQQQGPASPPGAPGWPPGGGPQGGGFQQR